MVLRNPIDLYVLRKAKVWVKGYGQSKMWSRQRVGVQDEMVARLTRDKTQRPESGKTKTR